MRLLSAKTFVCGILGLSAPAFANDAIDCGYPLNNSERTYCAEKALDQANQDLTAAFGRALEKMIEVDASLPEHLKGSPDALKAAQAAWTEFRHKDCTAYSFPFKGGTRGNELYRNCMIVMTMQRIDDLNAMVEDYGG